MLKNKSKRIQAAEMVGVGHPDKIADQISDCVLNWFLRNGEGKNTRVAIETLISGKTLHIAGEVKDAKIFNNFSSEEIEQKIKREVYKKVLSPLNYDNDFYWIIELKQQSEDIAQAVEKDKEVGAGDQGIVYGYATNETEEFMPLSYVIARDILKRAEQEIKNGNLSEALFDMKSEVVLTETKEKTRIRDIVLSIQHGENLDKKTFDKKITKNIIMPVVKKYITGDTGLINIQINPSGRFVKGGPEADAGLTGRKLMVDTYGTIGKHGGGAFSGKDGSKVDRSGAYLARYIAKNIVAAGFADKAEVQLVWVIGSPEPLGLNVEFFGTNKIYTSSLIKAVKAVFKMKVSEIMEDFNLSKIDYQRLSTYGHFGRSVSEAPWEKLDKVEELKKYVYENAKKLRVGEILKEELKKYFGK